jgi:hypothetical protein
METIYPTIHDDGALGARIDATSRPRGCPGLGGWKWSEERQRWWTRVKGQEAGDLIEFALRRPDGCIELRIDGDRIAGYSA